MGRDLISGSDRIWYIHIHIRERPDASSSPPAPTTSSPWSPLRPYPEYSRANPYPWSPFPPRRARPGPGPHKQRNAGEHAGGGAFFIDNLLVQIHFIIVMIRWSGLAPLLRVYVVERVEGVVNEERRVRPQVLLLQPFQDLRAPPVSDTPIRVLDTPMRVLDTPMRALDTPM